VINQKNGGGTLWESIWIWLNKNKLEDMGKCVLKPSYGDMSTVVLGSGVKSIKKSFRKHWDEVLYMYEEYPDEYPDEYIKNINRFLDTDHKSIDEIESDYRKNFNEDYHFEETY